MKQKRFYILIINVLIGITLHAQQLGDVVQFADSQFNKGNFSIAAQEYNRALFFGYDDIGYLSMKIGHCYIELSDYEQAASFYDRSYRYASNDSIKNEAVLGKTFCLVMNSEHVYALSELLNLTTPITREQEVQSYFLSGIAHYGLENDTLAFENFNSALESAGINDSLKTVLQTEFEKVYRYKKRFNPTRSYILSAIIPGSGQTAVGAFKEGINSLILLSVLYYLTFEVAISFSVLDAIITFLPWFQRYYFGGMEKAKGLAVSKIEKERYKSYLQILEHTTPDAYR
ncbi:MAG: hypothetical protein K9H26_01920 [Prolixibacteraceae bacterium]|nr:hypothetical protein [Prolixibacteraceae bacterium]